MSDPRLLRIVDAQVERRSLPLKTPYVLSFVTLEAFETLLVQFQLDNSETWLGEVVPLPGYAAETVETVLDTVASWLPKFSGQTVQNLRQTIASQITVTPFASSLMLSAIDAGFISFEQFQADAQNSFQTNCKRIPLVYPTSSAKPGLEQIIEQAVAAGYRTIKVKVGECLAQDLEALPQLQRSLPPGIQVRFDANQGYSYTEARSFLRALETHLAEQTELVEQPLPPAAWNDMAQLAQHTTVPLMLDESIYTGEDVDRAVQVGCQWIKLKLCKQGGAQELLRIAEYAKQLGLGVVIGNGVATDIVNLLELQLYHRHAHLFNGASESNGFAKLQHPVLHKALSVESGCAVWEENSAPFSNSSTMTTG